MKTYLLTELKGNKAQLLSFSHKNKNEINFFAIASDFKYGMLKQFNTFNQNRKLFNKESSTIDYQNLFKKLNYHF